MARPLHVKIERQRSAQLVGSGSIPHSHLENRLFGDLGQGVHSSEFLVGVCSPVLQILTQFQTKIFYFPHPFSDLASKIHTRFQFSSNDIFWILLFLYYSFGVEKTNTFIRSHGSLENHTRFKTIMVKIYTRFQTKTAQKPYPLGRHIPI